MRGAKGRRSAPEKHGNFWRSDVSLSLSRRLSLTLALGALASREAHAACPGLYATATCDGGGANDICVVNGAADAITCTLAANGGTAGGSIHAVSYSDTQFDAWGVAADGGSFCCALAHDDACDPQSDVFVNVLGTDYADDIDLRGDGRDLECTKADVQGDGGADTITGSGATTNEDSLSGEGDNDTISGLAGADYISGGAGDDTCIGGDGDDVIDGNVANDILIGGDGDDTLTGDYGDDKMQGGDGVDTMYGDADDDQMCGGPGGDIMDGGTEDDVVFGGAAIDTVYGGADYDVCGDSSDSFPGLDCNSYTIAACPI